MQNREDQTVWRLTAADLDAYAGRELSDDELFLFGEAFGNSSVNECIEGVLGSVAED